MTLPLFLACADGSKGGDGATDDTGDTTSGPVGRGPGEIALDGYPNGLWWDDASSTLYIADDRNNRVLTWTDDAGIGVLGDLPAAAAASPGLGQPVLVDDRIVVPRFGDGAAGTSSRSGSTARQARSPGSTRSGVASASPSPPRATSTTAGS